MNRQHHVQPGDVAVYDGLKFRFTGNCQGVNVVMLPQTVDEPEPFKVCNNDLVLKQTIEDWVTCAN